MASRETRRSSTKGGRAAAAGVLKVRKGDGPSKPQKRPSSIEDLYGGGILGNQLKPEFLTSQVFQWLQKRHSKGTSFLTDGVYNRNGHTYKVPYGVRDALTQRLSHSQIATKYPFYVTWISPKSGKRLRKFFMSLPHAIIFVAERAQYVDEDATIVARHGFYIPSKLMGKFPRRMGDKFMYWCPHCMGPKTFRRTADDFFAQKKFWSDEKGRYIWKDVRLAVLECKTCGSTNRPKKFRASNQPVEVRKFKKGVRRAKRRQQ